MPRHSVRETLIKEYHEGGLGGHFGEEKTIALVSETFYWPKLAKDVIHVIKRCVQCLKAKAHKTSQGLYQPLPTPQNPWEDVSLDFITGLTRISNNKHSIMVVVVGFLRWLISFLVILLIMPLIFLIFTLKR